MITRNVDNYISETPITLVVKAYLKKKKKRWFSCYNNVKYALAITIITLPEIVH